MSLAPYISVVGAAEAIEFYKRAFLAEELERYDFEGKVGHCALRINGGTLFLADEFPDYEEMVGNVAPPSLGNRTTFTISLRVDSAATWFDRALAEGCEVVRPVKDEFFGKHGKLRDPYGHVWGIVELKPQDGA